MAISKLLAIALLLAAALLAQAPPMGFPGGPGGFPGGRGGPGGPGRPGGMRQGDGIWHRNAYFGELETFDSCFGHQPGNGEYHHHVQPVCLRAQLEDNLEIVTTGRIGNVYREKAAGWRHSPILGWSFDGYPIYGPYGYSDPHDPKSAIARIRPGFRLRRITTRDSLPDWALSSHPGVPQHLDAGRQGPPINDQFPLGRYVEDYEYVPASGDLDQYNGRFTVTPEFPKGTYAYFVTIDQNGKPAFPFIFGLEYYGSVSGGRVRSVPDDAQDYFTSGAASTASSTPPSTPPSNNDALLKSWFTRNSGTLARAVTGWDPSAGPQTTWPTTKPEGARAAGGLSTPANADVQRIRNTGSAVYVNSNGLPSYVIGPWFESRNGGVFLNLPSQQRYQMRISREPQSAQGAHTRTPMGPAGIWVNGVAAFNALDGASYSRNLGNDTGGGLVATSVLQVSMASREGGPVAPGSLITATADFGAKLATSTERATGAAWPTTLGGATVTVLDSAGVSHPAAIFYASPSRIDYRVPEAVAMGIARVTVVAGDVSIPGELNIVPFYPGVFQDNAPGMATAPHCQADDTGRNTLVLYGTGFNNTKDITVTIAGRRMQPVSMASRKTYPGLDEIHVVIPPELAGKERVEVVVTAAGKPSNPVHVALE